MLCKRNLSVIVIASLLFTFFSTAIATPVLGKSSRVAVITDLKGSATIKGAGSSREYDAYIDMGLNQGDYITTDANSSMKVKIKDHEDEFTIGANAVLSITTLTDKGKGKKSKIKLLAGSVWSNVKSLSGGDDYEVETPTAVMAVRGTKVLTGVDSETGETYVAVAAGTVSANTNTPADETASNTGDTEKQVLIAASQQLSLDSRDEVKGLESKVAIIDPEKLVKQTSPEIIEAIVKDKADIDRENAEFIAAQKDKIAKGEDTGISRGAADSSLTTKDLDALDKVTKNLDNLVGNVVKQAIADKKVDKAAIDKVIEDMNKNITDPNKKLDLDKVIPLDKTAGVDAALQIAKDAELKKLEEAKKAAEEAKKLEADAQKLKLGEALKKLEEEKARIAKEKEALGLNLPTPTPIAIVTATPTASPVATATPNNSTTAPTVATPVFSVGTGSYNSSQTVEIAIATAGTTLYYTDNGQDPTSASTPYTGAITVSASKTLKAIAIRSGWNNSAIATAAYTIVAATPIFSVGTGSYTSAQTVEITSATAGALIYYTDNGQDPTSKSTLYTVPLKISSSQTLKAIALKAGLTNSAIATADYTITISTVATPTFNIDEGSYTSAQSVTITSATAGAKIYYTINGPDPTSNSTKYEGPITISSSQTIRAIAISAGLNNSAIATASYIIAVATPTFSVQSGSNPSVKVVSITTTPADADIYYTIDESIPTIASIHYTGPITISSSQTLKAIAVKTGLANSAIGTAAYTIPAFLTTPVQVVSSGSGNFTLSLNINNLISADQIAGFEVHVVSGSGTILAKQTGLNFASFFLSTESGSVTRFSNPTNINNETIFAAVQPKSITYPILGEQLLVSLPLHLTSNLPMNTISIYVKLVRSNGSIILDTFAMPLTATVSGPGPA